jgi:hypothetical protein
LIKSAAPEGLHNGQLKRTHEYITCYETTGATKHQPNAHPRLDLVMAMSQVLPFYVVQLVNVQHTPHTPDSTSTTQSTNTNHAL